MEEIWEQIGFQMEEVCKELDLFGELELEFINFFLLKLELEYEVKLELK